MDNLEVKAPQVFVVNVTEDPSASNNKKSNELETTLQINVGNAPPTVSSTCRTCATDSEFVIPIFDGEGLQNNLADKIHQHLPIQVRRDDTLPLVMCYQCASTLLAWHELQLCCRRADIALRELARAVDQNKPSTSRESKTQEIVKDESESGRATKKCQYCPAERGADLQYKRHLLSAHAEEFFHCAECDTYVDRNSLLIHMSVHALHYATTADAEDNGPAAADGKREVAPARTHVDNATDDNRATTTPTGDVTSADIARAPEIVARAISPDSTLDTGQIKRAGDEKKNEFSDHSDNEDGFDPLPESIFAAIADSQEEADRPPADDEAKKVKNKPRACPVCHKVYRAASSYFYHMKHMHGGGGERHECAQCGRRYRSRASLRQHLAAHSGRVAFECDACGKRYRSKASLYVHIQTHAADKDRHSCAKCGRSFRWRQQLLRHEKRHAAARAYACTVCGRGFNVRCDMLRHARTHAAGSHVCADCGRCFAQIRYLKVHREKKHPHAADNGNNNIVNIAT